MNIAIGKFTLESLTTGMYINPMDVFREYIQNSVDSFDEAYETGLLRPGEEKILITINQAGRNISIDDNGVGLAVESAVAALADIGNSRKRSELNRGFRGIGRLAGLSYADRLVFTSSHFGEAKKTEISFDALRLRDLLVPSHDQSIDITELLNRVITTQVSPAPMDEHYFRVELSGVRTDSGLLASDDVYDFLAQSSPVSFNTQEFSWAKEITDKAKEKGHVFSHYNIWIQTSGSPRQVFKPYADKYLVDKSRRLKDAITGVNVVPICSTNGDLLAVVWYAEASYSGAIVESRLRGLRFRKGNILVGDHQTVSGAFKDPRFNGWVQGEIHILSSRIIPNSRRDDFERNEEYVALHEKLSGLTAEITKQLRQASNERSQHALDFRHAEETIQHLDAGLASGYISPSRRGAVTKKIKEVKNSLSYLTPDSEEELERQYDIFHKLDIILGTVSGGTSYMALNLMSHLSQTEKKVLERVFRTIQMEVDEETATRLGDAIVEAFRQH
ncbi:MAG: hypothetical protein FD169_518 [Bacillota bacterium]|nr:MAG: hypothetical protein FD169_518 [Bacillota bacterium]